MNHDLKNSIVFEKQRVAIFGAGVAGLATAHFLVDRGFDVDIYETLDQVGGMAKSDRDSKTNIPSEYSWRAFGPWYKNTFDILKTIPVCKNGKISNVFDERLSPPIKFYLCPDQPQDPKHIDSRLLNSGFSWLDFVKLDWMTSKAWMAAPERSCTEYAHLNAGQEFAKVLSKRGAQTFKSILGPFTGSGHDRVSYHTYAQFIRKNVFPGFPAPYHHKTFSQGGLSGWLNFTRPINEAWFDPWVAHLESRGVKIHYSSALESFKCNGRTILSARLQNSTLVQADQYVLAVTPFAACHILDQSGMLGMDKELDKFAPLVQEGEHIQISFRLGFSDVIKMVPSQTRENAIVLVNSEYNMTILDQSRLFSKQLDLGTTENGIIIKTLWSGTTCVDKVPGKLFGLPVERLTRQQFDAEVLFQIYTCENLNQLIQRANCGQTLESFELVHFEVWHEWIFPTEAEQEKGVLVRGQQPKWVTTSRTQEFQPNFKTSFGNLYLAGAHTRTTADLYCMEAAVESGRNIADHLSFETTTKVQHTPAFLLPFQAIDSIMYRHNLPNIGPSLFILFFILTGSIAIAAIVSAFVRPKNSINVFAIVLLVVSIVSATIILSLYWHRKRTIEFTNYR